MTQRIGPPRRLYKYRRFSEKVVEALIEDTVYYADPATFNDPLDTRPILHADLDAAQLEIRLARLMELRVAAEMEQAARTIRYRGPRTLEHIARQSRKAAEQLLAEIRYNATNPFLDVEHPTIFLLAHHVEKELLLRYGKGIYSLAERANCPLMWSHYGDQHKGLCLGYSVPTAAMPNVHKVQYGGSRLVKASDVAAMLDGDEPAQRRVDEAVLLKKARAWSYEREWRLVDRRGEHPSPLELEEVVFGMRCPIAVRFAVIKALHRRDRAIRFFEIGEHGDGFELRKRSVDVDELRASLPQRNRAFDDVFDDLDAPD